METVGTQGARVQRSLVLIVGLAAILVVALSTLFVVRHYTSGSSAPAQTAQAHAVPQTGTGGTDPAPILRPGRPH